MLISDISYLENVSDKNIEGGSLGFFPGFIIPDASFSSSKSLDVFGKAVASAFSKEELELGARTGNKTIDYKSITFAVGLV